jgi:hypothetical protein
MADIEIRNKQKKYFVPEGEFCLNMPARCSHLRDYFPHKAHSYFQKETSVPEAKDGYLCNVFKVRFPGNDPGKIKKCEQCRKAK